MEHDGFQKAEDKIQPTPIRMVAPPGNLSSGSPMMVDTSTSEMKLPEISSGQTSQVSFAAVANAIGPMNSSQHPCSNARMMSAANNSQTLAILQGYLTGASMSARLQQVDQSMLKSRQQQQQQMQQNAPQLQQQQRLPSTQLQRSSTLLSTNPLSQMISQNSDMQMGTNQMVINKPLQLQIVQQQQLPRKMMVGLNPAMSMGNKGNNVMGLGNLDNVIGMGGMRAISSPIEPMSGSGNMSPHQMNLVSASNFSAGIAQNSLTHAQAAAMASKFRMAQQNRAGLYSQSGIAGMRGSTNQMLPSSAGLSMLSALNQANMNSLQRNAMSAMGPPKGPGANFYLNPQQQQQLQPLQQQPQQQQIQQQISSSLQQAQVGSPPMVGSPSAMLMQHQQISPLQMGQQTAMSPQQLSSGALQQINNSANPGAGPTSPQLSSQTHGSVGSITSSPMEQLQGANKAGSANNA